MFCCFWLFYQHHPGLWGGSCLVLLMCVKPALLFIFFIYFFYACETDVYTWHARIAPRCPADVLLQAMRHSFNLHNAHLKGSWWMKYSSVLRKHGDDCVILIRLMPHCSLWVVPGSQGYLSGAPERYYCAVCVTPSGCDGSNPRFRRLFSSGYTLYRHSRPLSTS